jgi:hypothetical protein
MEQYAYSAGLIDGEGTITLSKEFKHSRFRYPCVSISSTTYELLEYMKTTFGGSISNQKKYKDHYKNSWSWKLDYDRALVFLEKIFPYMKEPEKIRRANLLLKEYKSLTPRNGKYTELQTTNKLRFEAEFFGGPGGTPIP